MTRLSYDSCGLITLSPSGVRAVHRLVHSSSRRAACPFGVEPLRTPEGTPVLGVYAAPDTRRAARRAQGEVPHLLRRLRRALRSTGTSRTRDVVYVSSERIDAPVWWDREVAS